MKHITIESTFPYISIVKDISKGTVEELAGEYIVKNNASYGLFFINVVPTEELILKAIKLYEALANENQFGHFVIKGELFDCLLSSTKSELKVKTCF